jgi:hypothetical protein
MLDSGMHSHARSSLLAIAILLGLAACKPEPGPEPADGGGPKTCQPEDCGPQPGMPNSLCPDGVTMSGPGACVATGSGCGWEIIECPASGEPIFCGGIAGRPCPEGQTCVDDPNDTCDPNAGGADCGGICK